MSGPYHDFGILPSPDPGEDYGDSYTPEYYDCVMVHMDRLDQLYEDYGPEMNALDTYFHRMSRPAHGLAYCGITLIPPASLPPFRALVAAEHGQRPHEEWAALLEKIDGALVSGSFLLHYGV